MIGFQRKITESRDWEGLIPKARGELASIKRNADLRDTLDLLPDVIHRSRHQLVNISASLMGNTLEETCRNIHENLYRRFQYKQDPKGFELIRTPQASFADRFEGIDCDDYTVLASSILLNLGIAHKLVVAKYPDPKTTDLKFSHIYLRVPFQGDSFVIDPVIQPFNYEYETIETIEIPMELQVLNGPPMDAMDLFTSEPLAGKEIRNVGDAQAAGLVPAGMTEAEYQQWRREEFIKRTGESPEAFRDRIRAQTQASNEAAMAKENAALEKMRAALRNRGVAVPVNAGRNELVSLLNKHPAPRPGGKISNALNRVNPPAALLRAGILAAMKLNQFGIAAKLKWVTGNTDYNQARAGGFGSSRLVWDHLAKVKRKLSDIYYKAGGKIANLDKAILSSRTGRNQPRPLAGPDGLNQPFSVILGQELYHSEFSEEGLSGPGLGGEPISTSAALAAASAVMGVIAALVKKKENEIKKEVQSGGNDSQTVTDTMSNDRFTKGDDKEKSEEEKDVETTPPAEIWPPFQWVKDNPIIAAGIGVGAAVVTYLGIDTLKKRKRAKEEERSEEEGGSEESLSGQLTLFKPNSGKQNFWPIPAKPTNFRVTNKKRAAKRPVRNRSL